MLDSLARLPTQQQDLWRYALHRGSAVLLVGAGISAESPSSLPLASDLSSRLVGAIAVRCGLEAALISQVESCATVLRPEVVADILLWHLGSYALGPVYSDLNGVPNDWHHHIATAMARGCSVITTNFDTLIEQACCDQGVPYSLLAPGPEKARLTHPTPAAYLIKLHGSLPFARDSTGVSLAFALKHVARGIHPTLKKAVNSVLEGRPLLVLGYAGRDDFDVRPFLLTLERTAETGWVVHDPELSLMPRNSEDAQMPDEEPALELQIKWGSQFTILRGQTESLQALFPDAEARRNAAGKTPNSNIQYPRKPSVHRCVRALVYVSLEARAFEVAHALLKLARGAVPSGSKEHTRILIDEAIMREKGGTGLHAAAQVAHRAVRAARKLDAPRLLANALDQYGVIARRQGAYRKAASRYRRALRLLPPKHRWRELESRIRAHRAVSLEYLGRYSEAIEEYKRVLRYEKRRGDLRGAAMTISNLAIVHSSLGDLATSERLFRESIRIKTQTGNLAGIAASLQGLGRVHFFHGDKDIAFQAFSESYELRTGRARDPHGAAQALVGKGRIALYRGDTFSARAYATESLALMTAIGDATGIRLAEELIALCDQPDGSHNKPLR